MAGSKEQLRCINAKILFVISQMGKIFIRFVVPSAAIRKIFNMLNVGKAGLRKTRFFKKKTTHLFFLTRLPAYSIFVLRFRPKKQQFSVALPTP